MLNNFIRMYCIYLLYSLIRIYKLFARIIMINVEKKLSFISYLESEASERERERRIKHRILKLLL